MDLTGALSRWRAETFWTKEVETISWLKFFSGGAPHAAETLVDVGANVGIYSLFWLTLSKNSKVLSCEPFVENYSLLKSNLELNGLLHRAELVSEPLYSQSTPGTLFFEDSRPGSSGLQFNSELSMDKNDKAKIYSKTLDQLLLDKSQHRILKIDVDGLDFEILKGAKNALESQTILSVLIEAPEECQREISAYLKKFSFSADRRFDEIESHSDVRRMANNQLERNRVYTLKQFL